MSSLVAHLAFVLIGCPCHPPKICFLLPFCPRASERFKSPLRTRVCGLETSLSYLQKTLSIFSVWSAITSYHNATLIALSSNANSQAFTQPTAHPRNELHTFERPFHVKNKNSLLLHFVRWISPIAFIAQESHGHKSQGAAWDTSRAARHLFAGIVQSYLGFCFLPLGSRKALPGLPPLPIELYSDSSCIPGLPWQCHWFLHG